MYSLHLGIFVNILPSISGNAAVVTWFIIVAPRLPFPYQIVLCLAVAEFKKRNQQVYLVNNCDGLSEVSKQRIESRGCNQF